MALSPTLPHNLPYQSVPYSRRQARLCPIIGRVGHDLLSDPAQNAKNEPKMRNREHNGSFCWEIAKVPSTSGSIWTPSSAASRRPSQGWRHPSRNCPADMNFRNVRLDAPSAPALQHLRCGTPSRSYRSAHQSVTVGRVVVANSIHRSVTDRCPCEHYG